MVKLLRLLFFLLIVRLVVLIILGLRIRHKERLPVKGPAILVANHNSHLDTLVLMSLFPLHLLPFLQPVAAADYFLANPYLAWFALHIIGIIPVERQEISRTKDPLAVCATALAQGQMLIFYPEGSRGEPEQLSKFKSGIVLLAKSFPSVPIYPIFLHGLGKSLPRGSFLLVPFFCDVFIGEPIYWTGERRGFMDLLNHRMESLAAEENLPAWE
uniref:Phospholipid/glycerol acyltransferase n=1 Tax=Cyanothece sp. (strain PCC 7425 / ATCC 29141) TaxID=395961 RepID=B8HUF5_CYAP4